ncbi:MAG: dihydrofolate reductase family protein [Rhodobacter sp.]|nr:dihydrofolate reductase family protein [Rhodobacter sp.]
MPSPDRPFFTLTVVTSADGYIARARDDAPQQWASAEEQALFFADVAAADWAIMGRHTHEAADRPDRHRIVLSSRVCGWRRPTQLWLDPDGISPRDLPDLVASRRPLRNGLILGGTRVHDWFLAHAAIDRVHLTVEPAIFGAGLPLFTGTAGQLPGPVLEAAGFRCLKERRLNTAGTVWSCWCR